MKHGLTFVFLLLAQSSFANPFFSKVRYYIHVPTMILIELSEFDFNRKEGTAKYFSYAESKHFTVQIKDIAATIKTEIAGVKAGEHIVIKTTQGQKVCSVNMLFENSSARISCQTGKIIERMGIDRPQVVSYTLPTVDQEYVVAEIDTFDGVSKGMTATLLVDADRLTEGTEVTIEAVFANGDAFVHKNGISKLDSSELLDKKQVARVSLKDLKLQ